MDNKLRKLKSRENLLKLLQFRENNAQGARKLITRNHQFTEALIKRLGLEHELQGHQGCVNCLQWSQDGRLLASGSDDTNVILWDPFRHKQLQVVPTTHVGNIFSVKFLGSVNSLIATAAGDCKVLVQSLQGSSQMPNQILDCTCHINRVKRLATSMEEPNLFWSAGEDGLIMQYDLREQHECSFSKLRVLIDLQSGHLEVKCIAINPTKPHYLAVGVNDCYVRMYDRRMIKKPFVHQTVETDGDRKEKPMDKNCVQYYAPGHLAVEYSNMVSYRLATTYISFNSAGSEMLVNMGGEQIYLFDINNQRHLNEIKIPQFLGCRKRYYGKFKCQCPEGNGYLTHKHDNLGEKCACYYMRRAYKCFRRRWVGDLYSAARDYLYVTLNWPEQFEAYVGLIKCLINLKWTEEAQKWIDYFCVKNPDFTGSSRGKKLQDNLEKMKTAPKQNSDDHLKVPTLENEEIKRRLDSRDYEKRYVGHSNTTTDIKEANFLGEDGNYICAGSDEGIIFIWDKKQSSIVSALFGDVSIVNCIQPHPTACFIASSGIDPVVKLWSPMPEDDSVNPRLVKDINSVVETNQRRMAMDPFESMLVNMGYRIQGTFLNGEEVTFHEVPNCRTC